MSTAKIIKPTTITDAMLVSSTIAEPAPGETVWNGATAYTVGQKAIRTGLHREYIRLIAGTTATAPELDTVNWKDIGPTRRWAMFDRRIGTASYGPSPMTAVVAPGGAAGLFMRELVGTTATISMNSGPGGTTIYSRVIDLDASQIDSIYDWLFTPYEQRNSFALSDLPEYYTASQISVSVTGTGTVSAGVCQVGEVIEMGQTLAGVTVGMTDFGKKDIEDGITDVIEGPYSQQLTMKALVAKSQFNKLVRRLLSVRSTPCAFLGSESASYEALQNYGFYKGWTIDVEYDSHVLCSIEIESLSSY